MPLDGLGGARRGDPRGLPGQMVAPANDRPGQNSYASIGSAGKTGMNSRHKACSLCASGVCFHTTPIRFNSQKHLAVTSISTAALCASANVVLKSL